MSGGIKNGVVLRCASTMSQAVDVVMITWNKLDLTRRAIESYRRHVRHPYRLICVDNGSTDGTLEYLRERADLVIANSANVGAVRARNQGYAVTTSELVLFSDNDIEFESDIVARLVRAMEREPRLGFVGPLLSQQLEEIGRYPAGASIAEITALVGEGAPPPLQDLKVVPAACVLFRRALIDEVGPWDVTFDPYGHEDYDFTLRARARGWRVAIAPDCYVHHHGTGARALPGREELVEKNLRALARRWGIRTSETGRAIVAPYPLPAESVPGRSHLPEQLKLLERTVAGCRLPANWGVSTRDFLAVLPDLGQEVLVVGCGSAEAVKQLRHRWGRQAVGVVPWRGPDQVYGTRQGHGYDLPFDDGTFDAVIARHSLEHSPMPLVNLMETARVLRPNGLGIVCVPAPRDDAEPRRLLTPALTDTQWQRLFGAARLRLLRRAETRCSEEGPGYLYLLERTADREEGDGVAAGAGALAGEERSREA